MSAAIMLPSTVTEQHLIIEAEEGVKSLLLNLYVTSTGSAGCWLPASPAECGGQPQLPCCIQGVRSGEQAQ